VIGAAALGALVTVLTGREPGFVLGVFLIAGTTAAALAVQPSAVYLIIPVPALAYVVAAATAGLIQANKQAAGTSLTALALSAAQWTASGFLAMTVATILAIAVTASRWRRQRSGPPGPGLRWRGGRGASAGPRPAGAGRSPSARRPPGHDADYATGAAAAAVQRECRHTT